jgi:hypothetical protein
MKKIVLLFSALCFVISIQAQQSKKEIKQNVNRSASCYYAYPGPTQTAYTAAPAGYKPFYISHYGRHGSRYLIGKTAYTRVYDTLKKADEQGKLTDKGKDVLAKVQIMIREASGRDGELTLLGAQQHQGITTRMYQNFPEVFAGKTNIDAKSTIVIRCILSMENGLQGLLKKNPELQIRHDASYATMYYMNHNDKKLNAKKWEGAAGEAYQAFCKKHDEHEHTMKLLFNDDEYWQKEIDATQLSDQLFELASDIQSTEMRQTMSLYDLFNEDEIYNHWLCNNANWYVGYGPCTLNGGTQPFTQRFLLKRIIEEADSCIALEHPGATLRYGHDTMVYPLTCLLGLNGKDKPVKDLEDLDDADFCDYNIVPMAANIQFIFYRKAFGDSDILVKVLDNENEATLPIKSDVAPYYHWKDFKEYYLNKLAGYKE